MIIKRVGLQPISKIIQEQEILIDKKKNGDKENYILLCEHTPVYSAGSNNDKVCFKEEDGKLPIITRIRAPLFITPAKRGGKLTFHGPGQIVVYLILDLQSFAVYNPSQLTKKTEHCIIQTLKNFGIHGIRNKNGSGTEGVWTNKRTKIASLGFRLQNKNRFSSYGFALNVSTDLSYFNDIYPCGLKDIKMTSMEKVLGKPVSMDKVRSQLVHQLFSTFLEMG
jgi:lipoyl(octanoyl) transferase